MMRRKGLSYLEVLIAAGIALTGILGAVALFPVAIMNLRKGQTADVAAGVGSSALQSTSALHIDEPHWWKMYAGSTLVDAQHVSYPSRADFQGRQIHPALQPFDCLCFDPRFVASVTTWDATQSDPTLFPAIPMATPLDARMRRMTLAGAEFGSPRPVMSTSQARLLFKSQDDLLFEKPGDKTAPARQLVIDNGAVQRRDYFADYEFIVTACPVTTFALRPDRYRLPDGSPWPYDPANIAFLADGDYELSVVVFRERYPDLSEILTAGTDPKFIEEERLCDVAFLTPGYNGGDVTATLRAGRPLSDLNVAQSSWALVSGVQTVVHQPPPPPAVQTPAVGTRPVFQWYRVASFSEVYGSSRDLTLDGPDWFPNTSNLRITFISGVAGVFTERTQLK